MTPDTLLRLANLTVPQKPGRGPTVYPDPLASPVTAAQALGLLRLDSSELAVPRELQKTMVELVDGLVSGRPVSQPAARLTSLARPSVASVRLVAGDDPLLRAQLEWTESTPVATLARMAALELGEIDVARLKRCERAACNLVFYDTTRSRTQRWHAEAPCGNRERQRRHALPHA